MERMQYVNNVLDFMMMPKVLGAYGVFWCWVFMVFFWCCLLGVGDTMVSGVFGWEVFWEPLGFYKF